MDRVSIYEYDRKNRERVVKAIEEAGGQILSWSFFAKDQSKFELPPGTLSVFIDLSSLFYNEDRADALIAPAELLLDRKSTRLNSSHVSESRMPSSA